MKQEAVQSILRSNHFAQTSMQNVSEKLQDGADAEFKSKMQASQRENLENILAQMPEERARPSLLTPTGSILANVVAGSSIVLGQEKTDLLVGAIEKGIQHDVDEQLRILNENEVDDAELRKLLIKIRDDNAYAQQHFLFLKFVGPCCGPLTLT